MKYIKSFESKKVYKIGDYVKIGFVFFVKNNIKDFLSKNIGQIVNIKNIKLNNRGTKIYLVKYTNVPKNIKTAIQFLDYSIDTPDEFIYGLKQDEIELATKEEIEQYKLEQTTNKYNI